MIKFVVDYATATYFQDNYINSLKEDLFEIKMKRF